MRLFGAKERGPGPNLLTMTPLRNLEWETGTDGRAILLVPKFRNRLVVRWFVPMLARPVIRVSLDEHGTYVWSRCDGTTPVADIGRAMAEHFGEPVDAVYERIGRFLAVLARDTFVHLDPPPAAPRGPGGGPP